MRSTLNHSEDEQYLGQLGVNVESQALGLLASVIPDVRKN